MVVKRRGLSESIRVVEGLASVKSFLSTGCTILDLALADRLPGGFPGGRISHIYGPESSCKSVICAEPMGSAQRQGGKAFMVDAECTFDFSRAYLFGLDIEQLNYFPSDSDIDTILTVEYLFDTYLPKVMHEVKGCQGPSIVSVDTLSSIPSETESDETLTKSTYGASRAKMLSAGFRRDLRKFANSNVALLFVDQTRDDINGYSKYTVSGGKAIRFYSSIRLLLEKSKNITNKQGKQVGIDVIFTVQKNKIAPPFRSGVFSLLFDYGIDDIRTNIQWLKENGATGNAKTAWFSIPGSDKKFNSMNAAIRFVEDNNLEDKLIAEVYSAWREIYSKVDRKKRSR